MYKKRIPTPAEIRDLLLYDPETGILTWLPRHEKYFSNALQAPKCNARWAGRQAFTCLHHRGYYMGMIFGKHLLAHRVAYAYMTGEWPPEEVDHINHERWDNRWCNLRAATRAQNSSHRKPQGLSRYLGVYMNPTKAKWSAKISKHGIRKHLGNFIDEEDAARAYDRAAIEMHKEFANLNFKTGDE